MELAFDLVLLEGRVAIRARVRGARVVDQGDCVIIATARRQALGFGEHISEVRQDALNTWWDFGRLRLG